MMKKLLVLYVLLMQVLFGNGQNLRFDSFDHYPGSPTIRISSLAQDGTGFLWMTTDNDLIRFDGIEFVSFRSRSRDVDLVPGNVIRPLYADSKGRLWMASRAGAFLYNDTLESFIHYTVPHTTGASSISGVIQSIKEDAASGDIFLLAEDGVLYILKDDRMQLLLDLPVEGTKFMTIDNEQNIWIGAGSIVFKYNIETHFTTRYQLDPSKVNPDMEIWDIIVDDSYLYVVGLKSEILRYNLQTSELNLLSSHSVIPNYYCILMDDSGKYFIGAAFGLNYYDPLTGENILYAPDKTNQKSLISSTINCLLNDRQGNLWVGTEKGLNVVYADQKFRFFGYSFGTLPREVNVGSLMKDKQGNLWVGYVRGGIDILNKDYRVIKSIENLPGLKPNAELSNVFFMYQDDYGWVWLGTYMHGLIKYNPATSQYVQYFPDGTPNSIKGADVRSMAIDSEGKFWFAVHGYGIEYFDPANNEFSEIPEPVKSYTETLSSRWPFKIMFDRNDNLWVGSTHGAACYNKVSGEIITFSKNPTASYPLTNNDVYDIMQDSKDRIWISTNYGLNLLENGRMNNFTIDNGLINNTVLGIMEDHNGKIWVATRKGISLITAISPGQYQIKSYNKQDGLEIDHYFNYAFLRSNNDNYLFFGGLDGFIAFHPDSITINNSPFNLVFTGFELFNKQVSVGVDAAQEPSGFFLPSSLNYIDRIVLKENQNHFTISFAALNLTRSVNNQYAYILEGFEKTWTEAGTRNFLTYTNLNPGTYTLKIKAANNDGIWSEEILSVAIKVIPPIWKSNLALVSYLCILILIIVFIIYSVRERERIKLQIEQKDTLDRMKTQFFINVSHELKTPLTLISSPLRSILESSGNNSSIIVKHEDLKSVYRNVWRLLRLVMQILDFRKIELKKINFSVSKNDIIPLLFSITGYFDYLARDKDVNIEIEYDNAKDFSFYFDADKMDKILYNVMSNAVRHSPKLSRIVVRVMVDEKSSDRIKDISYIRIEVEDSGKGIDNIRMTRLFERFYNGRNTVDNNKGTGIGLSIVKEFTEMHQGVVKILSPYQDSQGKTKSGCRVILLFPYENCFSDEVCSADQNRYNEIILENQLVVKQDYSDNDDSDEHHAEMGASGYKILIIEDDPELRTMLRKEIEPFHIIIESSDGESGVKAAIEVIPDLIISDVMMPGIDGFEVVKILKLKAETSHIPIILLTARTMESDEIQAYTTGADAFVKKPFHAKILIHLIESLIGNRLKLKKKFFTNYGLELSKVVPTATDEMFIVKLLKLIHDNISDPDLGIELLTRELYMSRAQLYKKVNAVTNTSVKLFIRKVRLTKAATILVSEKIPINEVAYAVGFDSLPYFSKCFQEEFGVSPSKYAQSAVAGARFPKIAPDDHQG